MSSPKARRHPVMPSIVKSETFIFALLVVGLAIYLPLYLSSSPTAFNSVKNVNAPTNGASQPVIQQPTSPVSPTTLLPATSNARPAPITYLVPYILSLVKIVINFFFRAPRLVHSLIQSTILRPLSYPLSLLQALLRPLTLLLEIVYIVLVRTPYIIASWIVRETIYPLYVFIGVATLLGGSVGLSMAQVPKGLMHVMHHIRSQGREPSPMLSSSGISTLEGNKGVSVDNDADVKVEGSDVPGIWRSRTLANRNRY